MTIFLLLGTFAPFSLLLLISLISSLQIKLSLSSVQ